MNEAEKLYPSPEPAGESVATEYPAFVNACRAIVSDNAAALGWHLGRSLLTRSEVWGLVWRIDFEAKGHPEGSPLVNRVICWGGPDGTVSGTATVFGQKPL
jgi:hypothetical protein